MAFLTNEKLLDNGLEIIGKQSFMDISEMLPHENIIIFQITYAGQTTQVHTYPNEYYSLMTLIADRLAIPGFGLCCGMGSCGTCLVQINNGYHRGGRNMLACSVSVNDQLSGATINVPKPF